MRLIDRRMSKTGVVILFLSITTCFFAVSVGIEDAAIEISDDLTLHSGDMITLQADDNTYITVANFVSCLSYTPAYHKQWRTCLQRTDTAHIDANSEFIVETAENDQIRLRTKDRDIYLRYFKEGPRGSHDCVGFPIILVEDTAPVDPESIFTVIKTGDDNKIALRASNGRYLNRVDKKVWAQGITSTAWMFGRKNYRLISAEADSPDDETAVFSVERTGMDPDYVQSVSDIKFDLERFSVSTTPMVITQINQSNNGSGEMEFVLAASQDISTTNKWTWEKVLNLHQEQRLAQH